MPYAPNAGSIDRHDSDWWVRDEFCLVRKKFDLALHAHPLERRVMGYVVVAYGISRELGRIAVAVAKKDWVQLEMDVV
jgi:hypothetical protein